MSPTEPVHSPSGLLEALAMPSQGKVYDLSSGWWRGMPNIELHPHFDVVTYRSPRGVENQGDIPMLRPENNRAQLNFMSELVIGTTHTGTHIDALCHIVCGPNREWHGGHSADTELGDAGALNSDATELPPMICRGLIFDVPALLESEALPPSYAVGPEQLQGLCDRGGFDVRPGDVALIRTGQMRHWPDEELMWKESGGAGISLAGAEWLHERGVAAVGADTAFIEVEPSGVPGSPQPVHIFLLQEHGVPILEWVSCEQVAADGVTTCLFVCLPLTIRGASGSMVRPVAIV